MPELCETLREPVRNPGIALTCLGLLLDRSLWRWVTIASTPGIAGGGQLLQLREHVAMWGPDGLPRHVQPISDLPDRIDLRLKARTVRSRRMERTVFTADDDDLGCASAYVAVS